MKSTSKLKLRLCSKPSSLKLCSPVIWNGSTAWSTCVQRDLSDCISCTCWRELGRTQRTLTGPMCLWCAWSSKIHMPGLAHWLMVQQSDQLGALHRWVLLIAYPDNSYHKSLLPIGLDTLHDRRTSLVMVCFANMLKPSNKLHHLIPPRNGHGYHLRFSRLNDPVINTGWLRNMLTGYGLCLIAMQHKYLVWYSAHVKFSSIY